MTERLFDADPYLAECTARVVAVHEGAVLLDRTVCYPTGGGQPGDRGELCAADGRRYAVIDTVKGAAPGEILHRLDPAAGLPVPGATLEVRLDWARRHTLMRYHSALHLLCAVVAAPVSGGRMDVDKAHLDFDIDMDKLDRDVIEATLNVLVGAAHPVQPGLISDAALDANPQLIKTMSVAPPRGAGVVRVIDIPGVDLQPCGGTHVRNTAEIGPVSVTRIRSEGKRNKRVTIALGALAA